MQVITHRDTPVADNPHGVDVRHMYQSPLAAASVITLQPGEAVRPHEAPVDLFFYVLEGAPLMQVEGETARVEPDTLVPSSAGRVHALRNESDGVVRVLVVKTPIQQA